MTVAAGVAREARRTAIILAVSQAIIGSAAPIAISMGGLAGQYLLAAERGDDGAGHETAALAKRADDCRGRQRTQRHTDIEAGDRRRRQRLVGGKQILAGQSAHRNGDRRGRTDDRLRDGQNDRRAARFQCDPDGDGHTASLPRPSPRTRRDTRSSTALTSFGSSSS